MNKPTRELLKIFEDLHEHNCLPIDYLRVCVDKGMVFKTEEWERNSRGEFSGGLVDIPIDLTETREE